MRKVDIDTLHAYVDADTKFCREYHPEADLIIFGYDYRQSENSIVWNEFNKVMRGIVVNGRGDIMAQPFGKFFTFKEYVSDNQILCTEGQIVALPDAPYVIKEKVDGSMGLLYWVDDCPYIATQRSFTNPNAQRASSILHSKYEAIIPKLNRDYTYVFEGIFPETSVLVDYGMKEELVLLGIVDNRTGEEVNDEKCLDIGFPIAKDYTSEYGHLPSMSDIQALNIRNLEGFVITYPDTGLKIKVKFDWYEKAHKLINSILSMERLIYKNTLELKRLMDWGECRLDYAHLSSEQKQQIKEGTSHIPAFFAQNGVAQWVEEMAQLPEGIAFNIQEQQLRPSTYTPMWNLLNKLKNTYI